MKTVEIVNTTKGCFVTRRYCGMNKGKEFFSKIAPQDMSKRAAKKYLDEIQQAKEKFIHEWIDD